MEEDTKGTDHETYGKQWYRFACLHKVCMILGSVVQKPDSNGSSLHRIIRYLMNTKRSWQLWWKVNVDRLSALSWSKLILIISEQEIQLERSETSMPAPLSHAACQLRHPVDNIIQPLSNWSRSLNFTEKVNGDLKIQLNTRKKSSDKRGSDWQFWLHTIYVHSFVCI